MKFIRSIYLLALLIHAVSPQAQEMPATDSSASTHSRAFRPLIVPVTLTAYGAASLVANPLRQADKHLMEQLQQAKGTRQTKIDDYLQYVPIATLFAGDALGLQAKNRVTGQAGRLLLSQLVVNAVVQPGKRITHRLRPDSSTYNAFPSGHTAEAFANAECLWQEYHESHPWLAASGFAFATATGFLRMYNNRHWFSDVMAGAGIGILSTKFSYWLYPRIVRSVSGKKSSRSMLMPAYQQQQIRLHYVCRL